VTVRGAVMTPPSVALASIAFGTVPPQLTGFDQLLLALTFQFALTALAGRTNRAIRPPSNAVNQMLPSGPAAIPKGALLGEMPEENSVTWPVGVIRPIRWPSSSVNQRLPSGPAVMSAGVAARVMPLENSVTWPV